MPRAAHPVGGFILLVALLIGAARARAEPGEPGEPAAPAAPGGRTDEPEQPRWYGWQIAAVDAPLLALAATSLDGSGEGAYIGVTGLVVSGPIVHGVHGEGGRAVGSAVLRVAAPALGALVGASTGHGEHEPGDGHTSLEGAAVGALVGYGIALGVDLLLAR